MTPNLFVATQTLFQPHKWFRQSKAEKSSRKTERWAEPVPGVYEYIPGRGWYLIEKDKVPASDKDATAGAEEGGPVLPVGEVETIKVQPPVPVRYSKVLKRYLLAPDYEVRKKYGDIKNSRGTKSLHVGFFRLDDEVSWVNCWDENGEFVPGPYRLWFFDTNTGQFRHMLRGDDPEYQRSHPVSRVQSRQNSIDHDQLVRRHSQESRSTEYRNGGGAGSTRANSTYTQSKPSSKAPSQANSRRGSFSRGQPSPRIPLDEAGTALKKLQKERAERASKESKDRTSTTAPKEAATSVKKPVENPAVIGKSIDSQQTLVSSTAQIVSS